MQAAVDFVLARGPGAAGRRLLLAGGSSGGMGTVRNVDAVRARLADARVRVLGVALGPWILVLLFFFHHFDCFEVRLFEPPIVCGSDVVLSVVHAKIDLDCGFQRSAMVGAWLTSFLFWLQSFSFFLLFCG